MVVDVMVSLVNGVYKCSICGKVVEVLTDGAGSLFCCGKAMDLQKENTVEASVEKHKPVVEKTANGYKVKVGSIPHPMEEKHYIQWIELIADGVVYRKNLKAGDAPEAEFCVKAEEVSARAYCNLHGLWKN
jgi:superoxide reductase